MTELQQDIGISAQHIRLLADGLSLVYHEARHVRFLISAGHLPGTGWEQLVSLPKNRVHAWRTINPVRGSAATQASAADAAWRFKERFRRSLEELQALYMEPHWKHASAVGGHAWRDVTLSVVGLRDALDHGPDGAIDAACARLLAARHNNGLVRDKIVELDKAIGAAPKSWWHERGLSGQGHR